MYSYCGLCILIVRPCILIVVYIFLDAATLTEVFPCFFHGCTANARVILAKTGHGPHCSNCCVVLYCCVVLCIVCFVSFYVLFVCKCVLPSSDNPIAVNKYIKYQNIKKSTDYWCLKEVVARCFLVISKTSVFTTVFVWCWPRIHDIFLCKGFWHQIESNQQVPSIPVTAHELWCVCVPIVCVFQYWI